MGRPIPEARQPAKVTRINAMAADSAMLLVEGLPACEPSRNGAHSPPALYLNGVAAANYPRTRPDLRPPFDRPMMPSESQK